MTAPLIGLTGRAGAGKDETGKVLARAGWRSLAFADALRIEVAEAWGIDIRLLGDRANKELPTPALRVHWCMSAKFRAWADVTHIDAQAPRSPRWIMQTWGSWRRSINPLHFVAYVDDWIRYQRDRAPGLVVTDVRLPNEAAMLAARGGHLVRVHRPDLPAMAADTAGHESERPLALATAAQIHNDGDLEHLQAEVWRVVNELHPTITTIGAIYHG